MKFPSFIKHRRSTSHAVQHAFCCEACGHTNVIPLESSPGIISSGKLSRQNSHQSSADANVAGGSWIFIPDEAAGPAKRQSDDANRKLAGNNSVALQADSGDARSRARTTSQDSEAAKQSKMAAASTAGLQRAPSQGRAPPSPPPVTLAPDSPPLQRPQQAAKAADDSPYAAQSQFSPPHPAVQPAVSTVAAPPLLPTLSVERRAGRGQNLRSAASEGGVMRPVDGRTAASSKEAEAREARRCSEDSNASQRSEEPTRVGIKQEILHYRAHAAERFRRNLSQTDLMLGAGSAGNSRTASPAGLSSHQLSGLGVGSLAGPSLVPRSASPHSVSSPAGSQAPSPMARPTLYTRVLDPAGNPTGPIPNRMGTPAYGSPTARPSPLAPAAEPGNGAAPSSSGTATAERASAPPPKPSSPLQHMASTRDSKELPDSPMSRPMTPLRSRGQAGPSFAPGSGANPRDDPSGASGSGLGSASAPQASQAGSSGQTAAPFTCLICFDEYPEDEEVFQASMCGHRMCRGCARQVALTAIQEFQFPIACPLCKAGPRSGPDACAHCAQLRSLGTGDFCFLDPDVQLLLNQDELENYMDKELKYATHRDTELVHCPKADCAGLAVVLGREPIFICPLCSYAWCRKCKCDWHSFMTCKQYQAAPKPVRRAAEVREEEEFQEYLRHHRTIACPTCGQGLQKLDGCNHLQCGACKSHVCWLCGQRIKATTYWEAYMHYWDESSPCFGATYDVRMG